MDASDLIKSLQRQPCEEGAVHIWGPDADRRAKLLIYQAMEGAILDAFLQLSGRRCRIRAFRHGPLHRKHRNDAAAFPGNIQEQLFCRRIAQSVAGSDAA